MEQLISKFNESLGSGVEILSVYTGKDEYHRMIKTFAILDKRELFGFAPNKVKDFYERIDNLTDTKTLKFLMKTFVEPLTKEADVSKVSNRYEYKTMRAVLSFKRSDNYIEFNHFIFNLEPSETCL